MPPQPTGTFEAQAVKQAEKLVGDWARQRAVEVRVHKDGLWWSTVKEHLTNIIASALTDAYHAGAAGERERLVCPHVHPPILCPACIVKVGKAALAPRPPTR